MSTQSVSKRKNVFAKKNKVYVTHQDYEIGDSKRESKQVSVYKFSKLLDLNPISRSFSNFGISNTSQPR